MTNKDYFDFFSFALGCRRLFEFVVLRHLYFSFPLLTDTLSLHCVITKCQQQLLLLFQYSNSDDAVNGEDGMMLQDDEGEEKKGNASVRTNGGWTNGSCNGRTNNLMSSVASVLLPNSSRSSLIQKRPSDRRFIQKGFFSSSNTIDANIFLWLLSTFGAFLECVWPFLSSRKQS